MGLALSMYVTDNERKYPYYRFSKIGHLGMMLSWEEKLEPYYPIIWTNKAYQCPGYKGLAGFQLGAIPFLLGYAYNSSGVNSSPYNGGAGGDPHRWSLGLGGFDVTYAWPDITEQQVVAPSEMFATGESRAMSTNLVPHYYYRSEAVGSGFDYGVPHIPGFAWDNFYTNPERHGKKYNVVYCDGHVAGIDRMVMFDVTKTAVNWNNDHQPHPEAWR